MDLATMGDHWAVKMLAPFCSPPLQEWPTTEGYLDVYLFPEECEFTVMQNLGPNAYVWGYLAGR
jgi:endoglucanase